MLCVKFGYRWRSSSGEWQWQRYLLMWHFTDRKVHCPMSNTVHWRKWHTLTEKYTVQQLIHWWSCTLSHDTHQYPDRNVHPCDTITDRNLNSLLTHVNSRKTQTLMKCKLLRQRCSLFLDTYTDRSVYFPLTYTLTEVFTFLWHIHWQKCWLSLDKYTDRGVFCPLTHTLTEVFTFPWHIHWQRCLLSFDTYTDKDVHCPLTHTLTEVFTKMFTISWHIHWQKYILSNDTIIDRCVNSPMTRPLLYDT